MFLLLTKPMNYIKTGSTVYLSTKLKDRGVDVMVVTEDDRSKKFIFQKGLQYQTKYVDGLHNIRLASSSRENPIPLQVHFADYLPDWVDDIEQMTL